MWAGYLTEVATGDHQLSSNSIPRHIALCDSSLGHILVVSFLAGSAASSTQQQLEAAAQVVKENMWYIGDGECLGGIQEDV